MVDNKLAVEEAQRAANYEALKSSVKSDVETEIARRAHPSSRAEAHQVENLAGDFRQKAIGEVVETDREIERGRMLARVSQVADYIFYVIYSLLAVRFLLELFAASRSAGFVRFIENVTAPIYAPFRGIVPSPSIDGFTLSLPILVALFVYALLHIGVNKLLRVFAHRKTEI
jgi:Predicted integral membrane protein